MANTCGTKSDNGGVEAAALRSSGCSSSSSNNSSSNSCARPAGRRQRRRPFGAAAAAMAVGLFLVGLLQRTQMAAATDFGYGDPIDVLVTAGDEIVLPFEGEQADTVAISIQQCSGNEYVRMAVYYDAEDGEELTSGSRLQGSQCVRIKANTSAPDSSFDEYNKLCAFKNSGPVQLAYDENTLNSSMTYDSDNSPTVYPSKIQVVISNGGATTATVQVVLFSNTFPAPSADSSIDRVHTTSDQEENTYTVDATFQAESSTDTFCDAAVCNVYAYYIEIDDDDAEADLLFGTTCQARAGVMVYEGSTSVSSTNLVGDSGGDGRDNNDDDVETAALGAGKGAAAATTASTTPYVLSACTEFPKNTAASYRVYLVVSPDTSTASTVGYGLRDEVLFQSDEIRVQDDMDAACPEIVVEDSGAARTTLVAAPGGAAAAAAVSGIVALVCGAVAVAA